MIFSLSLKQMLLEPIESSSTQMFFQMLHFFLDHKDRYHVTNGKLRKLTFKLLQRGKCNDLH